MLISPKGTSPQGWKSTFTHLASATAKAVGSPVSFAAAIGVVLAWAVTGPIFHFSDTWQLVINTGTTVVTFLMVFLIQHSQNRDSTALQLKLDEIIRSLSGAHNSLIDLEELTDRQLADLQEQYQKLGEEALRRRQAGESDTGIDDVPDRVRGTEK